MAFRQRLAPGDLDGRAWHVIEPDGSTRLNRLGRPTVKTFLFPKHKATPIARLGHAWHARHGVRGLSPRRRVRAGGIHRHARGSRAAPRPRSALCLSPCRDFIRSGSPASRLGIARAMLDEFIALAKAKTPRGLMRLADMPVVQSDVAHREAALGSGARVSDGNPATTSGIRRRHRADRHRGAHPRPTGLRSGNQIRDRNGGLCL